MENQCSPCSMCGSCRGSTFASAKSKQSWSLGSLQEVSSPLLGAQSKSPWQGLNALLPTPMSVGKGLCGEFRKAFGPSCLFLS